MQCINFVKFKRELKAASIRVSKVRPIELDSIGVDFIFFTQPFQDILLQTRRRGLQITVFIGNLDVLMQYRSKLRSILT